MDAQRKEFWYCYLLTSAHRHSDTKTPRETSKYVWANMATTSQINFMKPNEPVMEQGQVYGLNVGVILMG